MAIDPDLLSRLYLRAVVPRIAELCRYAPAAQNRLASQKPFTLRLAVMGGASQGISLDAGHPGPAPDDAGSDVLLAFVSPSQLNNLFTSQGLAVPLPVRGFWRISALQTFAALAKDLEKALNPSPATLQDPAALELYVRLSLHIAMAAAAQLAMHEPYSSAATRKLPDGLAAFSVAGTDILAWVRKEGTSFTSGTGTPSGQVSAHLVLKDLPTAQKLLEDRLDTMAAVGLGDIQISGLIPLIDGIGLVMERVALYLQPKA